MDKLCQMLLWLQIQHLGAPGIFNTPRNQRTWYYPINQQQTLIYLHHLSLGEHQHTPTHVLMCTHVHTFPLSENCWPSIYTSALQNKNTKSLPLTSPSSRIPIIATQPLVTYKWGIWVTSMRPDHESEQALGIVSTPSRRPLTFRIPLGCDLLSKPGKGTEKMSPREQ